MIHITAVIYCVRPIPQLWLTQDIWLYGPHYPRQTYHGKGIHTDWLYNRQDRYLEKMRIYDSYKSAIKCHKKSSLTSSIRYFRLYISVLEFRYFSAEADIWIYFSIDGPFLRDFTPPALTNSWLRSDQRFCCVINYIRQSFTQSTIQCNSSALS